MPLCLEASLVISFFPQCLAGQKLLLSMNCSQLPLDFGAVELTSSPFAQFVPQPKETF